MPLKHNLTQNKSSLVNKVNDTSLLHQHNLTQNKSPLVNKVINTSCYIQHQNSIYLHQRCATLFSFHSFPSMTSLTQKHIQLSSVHWLTGSLEGHEGQFSRDPLPVFPAGGPCEQFWHGAGMSALRCCPSSISSADRGITKVPWRTVLERLLWRATCLNHASFHLLIVARRDSCGPTRKLIVLRIQLFVLCSK